MKVLAAVAIFSGLFVGGCINKAHAIGVSGIAISSASRGHVSGGRLNDKLICTCVELSPGVSECTCLAKRRYEFLKQKEAREKQEELAKKEVIRQRMEPYTQPPPRELTAQEKAWVEKAKTIKVFTKEEK